MILPIAERSPAGTPGQGQQTEGHGASLPTPSVSNPEHLSPVPREALAPDSSPGVGAVLTRILDAEARRLLREADGDPAKATTGSHPHLLDGSTDDLPLRLQGEPLPILHPHCFIDERGCPRGLANGVTP